MRLLEDHSAGGDRDIPGVVYYFEKLLTYVCAHGLTEGLSNVIKLLNNPGDHNVSDTEYQWIKNYSLLLIELGFIKGESGSLGYDIADATKETELIRERIRILVETGDFRNSSDVQAIQTYGSQLEIHTALTKHKPKTEEDSFFENFINTRPTSNPLCDLYSRAYANLKSYAEKFEIPFRHTPRAYDLSAAIELSRKKYDLIIGVLKAGSTLALPMEAIGENVRYMEWHKHWKRKPVWRNVGRATEKPKKAKKILLCENDAVSGNTIEALLPSLEKLGAEEVDICFTALYPEKSTQISESLPLNSIYNTSDLGYKNCYSNLVEFRRRFAELYLSENEG